MNKIAISCLLILFLSSCVMQKKDRLPLSVQPKNSKELVARVNSNNITSEWIALKGKISLTLQDKNTVSLSVIIRTRKDSVIWASVRAPFGIELFRIMLTKDSLYYINHTNKSFFVKPISHVSEFINSEIPFSALQEILTGNINIRKKSYKFEEGFSLISKNINYVISPKNFRVLSIKYIKDLAFLEFEYSYSTHLWGGNFPKEVSIKSNFRDNSNMQLVYTKITLNEEHKLPFTIPSSYVEGN